MEKIIGLKDLRENTDKYIERVKKGERFVVLKRSKPVFTIMPPEESDELWEPVIDFTKIKRGGVPITDIITRL